MLQSIRLGRCRHPAPPTRMKRKQMTDEEIICKFMELRPQKFHRSNLSSQVWWFLKATGDIRGGPRYVWAPIFGFIPQREHLGRLHEVEERLTAAQRWEYTLKLGNRQPAPGETPELMIFHGSDLWQYIHASAEQKIRALAAVLRGEPLA